MEIDERMMRTYTDCNAVRLPHAWKQGAVALYWDCEHCPVSVRRRVERTADGQIEAPSAYLPSASTRRMEELWEGIDHA